MHETVWVTLLLFWTRSNVNIYNITSFSLCTICTYTRLYFDDSLAEMWDALCLSTLPLFLQLLLPHRNDRFSNPLFRHLPPC